MERMHNRFRAVKEGVVLMQKRHSDALTDLATAVSRMKGEIAQVDELKRRLMVAESEVRLLREGREAPSGVSGGVSDSAADAMRAVSAELLQSVELLGKRVTDHMAMCSGIQRAPSGLSDSGREVTKVDGVSSVVEVPAPAEVGGVRWSSVVGRRGRAGSERGTLESATDGRSRSRRSLQRGRSGDSGLSPRVSGAVPPAVVVRSVEPGGSAAEVLKTIKTEFTPSDLGIARIRAREAISGGIVLEVLDVDADSAAKADRLADRIRTSLGGRVTVTRPSRSAEFKISGIDSMVSSGEIAAAVASIGGCAVDLINVGEIRRLPGGLRIAWITCPMNAAAKLSKEDNIIIGWGSAKISRPRTKGLQCYKCWHFGHSRTMCKSSLDRAGLCFWCAGPDHSAKDCSSTAFCVICKDSGLNHSHRMGSSSCASAARFFRVV